MITEWSDIYEKHLSSDGPFDAVSVFISCSGESGQVKAGETETITQNKFDFGYINSALLNNVMQQFRDLIQKKSDAAASELAANMKTCNIKLGELTDAYKELE